MKVLIVFCIAAATVIAQTPRSCESPKQWEGRLARYDSSKNFQEIAQISYDELDRRVREIEEIEIGSQRDYYDILYLHNVGVEYRFNMRTRNCTIAPLSRPFIPVGFPKNAHFHAESTIGAAGLPNEHTVAVIFDGNFEGDPYFGAVTFPSCVPINFGFFSNRTGDVHTTYYDISLGIADPAVFVPPRECK